MKPRFAANGGKWRGAAGALAIGAALLVSGCNTKDVVTNGPVIDEQQLALVPVGSSRDQVLLALGTPSTTGTFDNEVFYYISQKRQRSLAFQKLKLVDQRVLAIYFDETGTVTQIADYGLKDGRLFDFISRTTPTTGKDQTLLGRILSPTPSKGGPPSVPQIGEDF
ncbi:MAG: outer membrane protein assembly factor BamE [Nitratireductor sp.]|nr:outer membrane protein assembly factor BamE [Nitratireductor sp.]